MLLWDDNPSEVDLLGFDDVAAPVLKALGRKHLDPVCVGVFGPWGAGKTTVIRLIQQALDQDGSTIVIYTQPWSYDPATDPKATLIGEVLNAVRSTLDDSGRQQLGARLGALAKRVRWSRAIRLAAESALTASLPRLSDLEGLFGEGDEITEPTLQGFRQDFAELLEDPAFSNVHRIVVVVDDLDRCLPGTVIDTLEAIKLFLAVPKMAFVIAADEDSVASAIASTYGSSPGGAVLAKMYLEKIVQIPVRVPTLGLNDVEAYMVQLLLWHRLGDDPSQFDAIRLHCAGARVAGERASVESLVKGIEGAEDDIALAERLAPIMYEELQGNPRRIKRLLNAYWVRSAIAGRRGIEFEVDAFAKLVLLEEVFAREFQAMLGWLSAGTLSEQIALLETGEGEFPSPLRRWGQLEPRLATLDIGRYLILAAALRGTTVTVSALPAALRGVAEQLTAASAGERRKARVAVAKLNVAERSSLAVHLADLIRFQPSQQHYLSESLMAVVTDSDEVASAAASVLDRMMPADVEPALIINLAPPGAGTRPPFSELVAAWAATGALTSDAAKTASLAMGSGT